MTVVALESQIALDEQGRAWIEGTHTRVEQVAIDEYVHGLTPRQMLAEHPHLTLPQIHAALAYYYEHKAEMDQQIRRQIRDEDAKRRSLPPSPIERRLHEQGLIR